MKEEVLKKDKALNS